LASLSIIKASWLAVDELCWSESKAERERGSRVRGAIQREEGLGVERESDGYEKHIGVTRVTAYLESLTVVS
jgi:hypothetical protein